jgi:stress response protein YsnF
MTFETSLRFEDWQALGYLDAAMAGPEISTEEHEVVLHEEVPVVEKRVVPKERVRMEKETRVEEEQVSEEVRKERIEAEGELDR